ncbi:MAG: N-acetyltransferase family protein [Chitinophagaceae bacterium]
MLHRLASPEDFENIYELYMEESANPYLTYDPVSKQDFSVIYDQLLETKTVFIVENEGRIIATYRLIPKTARQAHTVYLGSFTIRRDFQGKGFGKKILVHIRDYAAAHHKIRIELTVDVNNAAAIALYKKAGFEVEGTVRKSYRLNATNEYYDEYLMALLL